MAGGEYARRGSIPRSQAAGVRSSPGDMIWCALAPAALAFVIVERSMGSPDLRREFIAGPNFSGRSAALRDGHKLSAADGGTSYVGPYAEAALSGLSSTVRDEIALYRAPEAKRPSIRVRRSPRSVRRAIRRACPAASRCCWRCTASRNPTIRASPSTPR